MKGWKKWNDCWKNVWAVSHIWFAPAGSTKFQRKLPCSYFTNQLLIWLLHSHWWRRSAPFQHQHHGVFIFTFFLLFSNCGICPNNICHRWISHVSLCIHIHGNEKWSHESMPSAMDRWNFMRPAWKNFSKWEKWIPMQPWTKIASSTSAPGIMPWKGLQ